MKQQGTLIFDDESQRYKIRFATGEFSDGLHCGDVLDVLLDGEWLESRIEMSYTDKWYLVGVKCKDLPSLIIRK